MDCGAWLLKHSMYSTTDLFRTMGIAVISYLLYAVELQMELKGAKKTEFGGYLKENYTF